MFPGVGEGVSKYTCIFTNWMESSFFSFPSQKNSDFCSCLNLVQTLSSQLECCNLLLSWRQQVSICRITALFSKNSSSIQKSVEGQLSSILRPQPPSNLSPYCTSTCSVLLNRSSNIQFETERKIMKHW